MKHFLYGLNFGFISIWIWLSFVNIVKVENNQILSIVGVEKRTTFPTYHRTPCRFTTKTCPAPGDRTPGLCNCQKKMDFDSTDIKSITKILVCVHLLCMYQQCLQVGNKKINTMTKQLFHRVIVMIWSQYSMCSWFWHRHWFFRTVSCQACSTTPASPKAATPWSIITTIIIIIDNYTSSKLCYGGWE